MVCIVNCKRHMLLIVLLLLLLIMMAVGVVVCAIVFTIVYVVVIVIVYWYHYRYGYGYHYCYYYRCCSRCCRCHHCHHHSLTSLYCGCRFSSCVILVKNIWIRIRERRRRDWLCEKNCMCIEYNRIPIDTYTYLSSSLSCL